MSRKNLIRAVGLRRSARGQSLIEFALVSVLLFFLILGVIELSRLLFVYSVVSNAAQEGSRYGIARPRDVIAAPAATATVLAGGTPYIDKQVVGTGGCNVTDSTINKVYAIDPSEVDVKVWYDNGDGTPVVPTTRTPFPYDTQAIVKGNRINVEATYNFKFISPFLSALAPAGINIKIRSARTIMNNGDSNQIPCQVNTTPAPIPTDVIPTATSTDLPVPTLPPTARPTGTATPTGTRMPGGTATTTATAFGTATSTATSTVTSVPGAPTNTPGPSNTPTQTATLTPTSTTTITATPTPRALHITLVDARKKPQNGSQLSILVMVTDDGGVPFPGAMVRATAYINGNPIPYVVENLDWLYDGVYRGCPVGNYNHGDVVTVDITVSAPGYISDSRTGILVGAGTLQC
jgi:Flp pilus assembly protein TadG